MNDLFYCMAKLSIGRNIKIKKQMLSYVFSLVLIFNRVG